MVSVHGSVNGEGERMVHEGGRIRFVTYLKAHKRAAYVLGAMVMVHLSSQYDRWVFSFYHVCAAAGPERVCIRTQVTWSHIQARLPRRLGVLPGAV